MKKEKKTKKNKTILSIIGILITTVGMLVSTEYVTKTYPDISNTNLSSSNINSQENSITNETNKENIKSSNTKDNKKQENETLPTDQTDEKSPVYKENIPEYSGNIIIDINNNIPYFQKSEITTDEFENYSELDELNRAQVAFANISQLTMPSKDTKRGSLSYKPSGWNQYLYGENNSKHLYERCHLIAWQLGNENNNKKNLITGTSQLNSAMIEYENTIADWIKQKNKENKNYHVMYRVTPMYKGENKLATGVEIEAKSVEEKGISFNKFIYNIHDDFEIDYTTGRAKLKQ